MNIQELCRIRKEELKLTYQDISDASGVPLSTVQNFFSKLSKAPVHLYRRADLQGARHIP